MAQGGGVGTSLGPGGGWRWCLGVLSLEGSSYPKYLLLGTKLVRKKVGGGGYPGFCVVLRLFFCHLPEAQECILPQQHLGTECDASVWDGW